MCLTYMRKTAKGKRSRFAWGLIFPKAERLTLMLRMTDIQRAAASQAALSAAFQPARGTDIPSAQTQCGAPMFLRTAAILCGYTALLTRQATAAQKSMLHMTAECRPSRLISQKNRETGKRSACSRSRQAAAVMLKTRARLKAETADL